MRQRQARNGDIACLFIVVILVAVESQLCTDKNTWRCSNGECIWDFWRCDTIFHCDGSDDEFNCGGWACPSTSWKCKHDYTCILDINRCDGRMHCADGTDEMDCGSWTCPAGMWTCENDKCILIANRCDAVKDCADGSDELYCGPPLVESLTLDGHNDTITVDGDEHRTLNLTCIVCEAKQNDIIITKENDTTGNVTFRYVDVHHRALGPEKNEAVVILSNTTCDDTGIYTCAVGNNGTESKSIQLNVTCAGMKYGGNLTCPNEWEIGQNVKLTLKLDRSKWPSICRKDPHRREAWFDVTRLNDTGRQLIMCTVVNITSPGACQGAFTPGTIGCGCVSETKWHYTLELNFVMNSSFIGNWSVDTNCLRTDSSKPLTFHVAPECNVRLACKNKTYGAHCQESCGHCADDQPCNISTGHCLACLDGWLPPLCNEGCENKSYGARCQESCGHCADDQPCNASTGHCPACLDGWLPPLCNEGCENKTYGARCQESCGHCDDDQTCNASTGHCPACLDGWLPPLCKQGCENKTYGASCQESCGHCDDDQTCNASTGQCPACLDGWLPPFCKKEAPAKEALSNKEKIAIGVGVGVPSSLAFFASLYQVVQLLSNMGWMPCISFGNKEEDKKTEDGDTEVGKKKEDESEESDDAELSNCSRCCMCMFCGGCLGSCLFFITREKHEKMESQDDVESIESPTDQRPVKNDTKEPVHFERQERVASISEQADKDGSAESNLENNHEANNETRRKSIVERLFSITTQAIAKDRKKFMENYFTTAGWLADPVRGSQLNNPASWHRFYTSSFDTEKETQRSSVFTFNSDELVETDDTSQAGQTIGITRQDSNPSLRRDSAQDEEQVNIIQLLGDSEAEQGMSRVGQDGHSHDRSSESSGQPDQHEQTTENTQTAGNSDQNVLEDKGSHGASFHTPRRTSQTSEQPEQHEQTTGNTHTAGNSDQNDLEDEGSHEASFHTHRRTSQTSGQPEQHEQTAGNTHTAGNSDQNDLEDEGSHEASFHTHRRTSQTSWGSDVS